MHARFAIQDSVVDIVNRINNFDDEVKAGVWINSWTALNEAIIEITNLVVDSAKLSKLEFEQRQADIPKLWHPSHRNRYKPTHRDYTQ